MRNALHVEETGREEKKEKRVHVADPHSTLGRRLGTDEVVEGAEMRVPGASASWEIFLLLTRPLRQERRLLALRCSRESTGDWDIPTDEESLALASARVLL